MADLTFPTPHEHIFLGANHDRNARRTWLVIILTGAMMVAEIWAGSVFGSMALTADGWHMSTHAAAMLLGALAYLYARRQVSNPRFSFGTGKVGELAGFANAIVLAIIAVLIGVESFLRFFNPVRIDFGQAIVVAVIGLAVNLVSAWLLRDAHQHHGHEHEHGHAPAGGRDNNLRAAYMHVLADALTSVLAITALLFGALYGWVWLDPAIGIVGALVIARWSWGLVRDAGQVLLDYVPDREDLPDEIRLILETDGDRIRDLHVWQIGPGHHAVIVSLVSDRPEAPGHYKSRLAHIHDISHLTIEVELA